MAATTITSVLQSIWKDDAEPILVNVVASLGPIGASVAAILRAPLIGSLLTSWLNSFVDGLIAAGVIDVKVGVINYLSTAAQAKWAEELVILKQVSDAGHIMSAEEIAAYEAALQALVKNRPSIVHA